MATARVTHGDLVVLLPQEIRLRTAVAEIFRRGDEVILREVSRQEKCRTTIQTRR